MGSQQIIDPTPRPFTLPARIAGWLLVLCSGALAMPPADAGEVRIEGISGAMLSNAQRFVDLYQRKDDEKLSARWRANLHEDAPAQIKEALQPFGYYNAQVDPGPSPQGDDWVAVYRVDPGPPVRIRAADIQWQGAGAERPELAQALEKFPLKSGDVLVHDTYESGKAALQDIAYELGYVRVKPVEHLVRVFPDTNQADIRLRLDTGPLYRFGKITLHQEILDPGLLSHYVNLHEGEPYSNQKLLKFQQSLIATGWFSVVEIKPDFEAAQQAAVPIDVYLNPTQKHRVEFGLGYETDVGVRGSTRWSNKRVNRWGHQASARLQLAPVKGSLDLNYEMPVRNPRTDRLSFTSSYEYEDIKDSNRDTLNLEGAYLRTSLDKKNFFKLFAEYKNERFTSGQQPETTTNLLSLGGLARRTVVEKAEFIRSGYNVSADLRVASSMLLSDTGFFRSHFTGKYLYPIGQRGRLNLRGEIGASWVDDFEKYPTSLRFFAGGDMSVRGYDYKELGPRDAADLNTGGKNLLIGSIEYDHRIVGKWVGATFVDAGNAYNDTLDRAYVGAGAGVRWLAPFGSVRLDIGWPVSEDPRFSQFKFHLGLGAVL